jgi:hypothetical protein
LSDDRTYGIFFIIPKLIFVCKPNLIQDLLDACGCEVYCVEEVEHVIVEGKASTSGGR